MSGSQQHWARKWTRLRFPKFLRLKFSAKESDKINLCYTNIPLKSLEQFYMETQEGMFWLFCLHFLVGCPWATVDAVPSSNRFLPWVKYWVLHAVMILQLYIDEGIKWGHSNESFRTVPWRGNIFFYAVKVYFNF